MGVKLGGDFARLYGDRDGYIYTIGDRISSGLQEMRSIEDEGVHQSLAPAFGNESQLRELKQLNDALKIFIAVINRKILEIPSYARNWDTIQALFLKNAISTPMENAVSVVPKNYERHDDAWFKVDGSPDPKIIDEVMRWWTNEAVPVEDIRKDTRVDIRDLAKIVAWSGATITDFWSFWSKTEHHEKTVMNVGVLRYPSANDPYFTLYRLQVTAFSDSTRVLMYQKDTNGISSNLAYRRFRPNDENIRQMAQSAREQAIKEIDDLFP